MQSKVIKLLFSLLATGFLCGAKFDAFMGKEASGEISLSFVLIPSAGVEIQDDGAYLAWNGAEGWERRGVLEDEKTILASITITKIPVELAAK